MDIGRRVREVREDLGMQRTVLARRVGVAENTIYRIETAKRTPSMELLKKIARELRTEPAAFLQEPAVPLGEAPEGEPGSVPHVRRPHDSIEVRDNVKILLEEQFNALIHDLETIRRSKEAAELARVRDEVLESLAAG
jgi:transcriptional regulator with XRE-family HTH domain